jgi:hypothetical protein
VDERVKAIEADLDRKDVEKVLVEVQDPLADFMGALAWPANNALAKMSDTLCRHKVTVGGLQKEPENPGYTASLLVGSFMDYRPRVSEMVECLERNVLNPRIRDIHLFVEDPILQWENWFSIGDWEVAGDTGMEPHKTPGARWQKYPALEKLDRLRRHPKVTIVPFGRRPFFRDYFEYANKTFPEGRTVLVANSDIEFDQTVGLLGNHSLRGVFGCLAREGGRIFGATKGFPASASHDAWFFTTPVEGLSDCTWPLGIRNGEHLLAMRARSASYVLINPCLSISTKHHHVSRVRRWHMFPPITSKYLSVFGVSLEALKSAAFRENRGR